MALASAPVTPDRGALPHAVRRSFTAPPKAARASLPLNEADEQKAETLYAHPSGKIVSFTTSSRSAQRHSSVGDTKSEFQDEPIGILPWASITERTIAAGPLQIYRVLGSVAFLNSGKILQPLLAKSQCWCVDGVSKFVLRIRPHSYYRIELPCDSPAEETRVEEMKKALSTILQYEKTPCPFKRGFTVDLPEPPSAPVQKRPWRPKAQFNVDVDDSGEPFDSLEPLQEEEQNDRLPKDIGVFNEPPTAPRHITSSDRQGQPPVNGEVFHPEVVSPSSTERFKENTFVPEPSNFKTPTRPKSLRAGRTVTAPPQLSLRTSPPSTSAFGTVSHTSSIDQKVSTFSSSVESFHSFHSPISPLPPSPPSPDSSPEAWGAPGLDVVKKRQHRRDASEITVTGRKGEIWDPTDGSAEEDTEYHSPPDVPRTTTLIKEAVSEDIDRPSESEGKSDLSIRLRNTTKMRRRRPSSPLPSSSNLYPPYSPRAHMSGHHLTTAILQRTCSLLLGPPVQLVALMLRIAAKISRGVFKGTSFGVTDEGHHIPCSWDFSDGSGDDEGDGRVDEAAEEEDEDDYGFSLGKTVSGKEVRSRDIGGSWEID